MPGSSPRSPQYVQFTEIERLSSYRKGGYHPVHIDDIFHNRYRVVNKLGHGSYATVWLVEDLSSNRFVSVKILIADASASVSECAISEHLRALQQQTPSAAGTEYVMKVFDTFVTTGPNGVHRCIVSELLGPSLGSDIYDLYEDECFPPEMGKKFVAQIARGVAYLHKSGVIRGDLHLANMLLYHPDMAYWSQKDIEHYFGKPRLASLHRHDRLPVTPSPHLPRYAVCAVTQLPILSLCLESLATAHVKIFDFGVAFFYPAPSHSIPTHLHIPKVYAAPEILFNEPSLGPPTDIWALAVLFHWILSCRCWLFYSKDGVQAELVQDMVIKLGKFPDRWWNQWIERGTNFDDNGVFIGDRKVLSKLSHLFVKICANDSITQAEIDMFELLLRRMVRYEMKDRISAEDVMRMIPSAWIDVRKETLG